MRTRSKKNHQSTEEKSKKDCTVKDRVDAFHVSCQHTNKKQTNKQPPQKTRFYIRVNQGCLTEETLSNIQKIMKATWYLALHSSKITKSPIQANVFRFSLCRFCKNSTSHNIHPRFKQSTYLDFQEIDRVSSV